MIRKDNFLSFFFTILKKKTSKIIFREKLEVFQKLHSFLRVVQSVHNALYVNISNIIHSVPFYLRNCYLSEYCCKRKKNSSLML